MSIYWFFVDFITSKRDIFFRRNEILFYAEIQRKFTCLKPEFAYKYIKTSKASSIIEFELNFGKIKNFTESEKKNSC